MVKIAIATSSFAEFDRAPLDMLKKAGVEYVLNQIGRTLSEAEVTDLLRDCAGIAAGTEPLTRAVMQANPQLRVISRCGTGMDSVDRAAAEELGIKVFNTPDAPTQAAAEHTLALMLSMLRHIPRMDADTRAGVWKKRMGNLLCGKRVGIVGAGRIGRRVATLVEAFGGEVNCHDPFASECPYPLRALPDLLFWADIVSLHCAKPSSGTETIGPVELARMRKGSWLVNAARGGLVDENALAEAIREQHLVGAALDVFVSEPYSGPLRDLPQVVLSPHAASYAREARVEMETSTIRNLLVGLGFETV